MCKKNGHSIIVENILLELKSIYDSHKKMVRFDHYLKLMTQKRGEILPLGDFSPMGVRQKNYIDKLIAIDAEKIASEQALKSAKELDLTTDFRAIFVIVDEPKNGWTQRYLTEANWIFSTVQKAKCFQNKSITTGSPWIPIQLWTTNYQLEDKPADTPYIIDQTKSAIFRAYLQFKNGPPQSLAAILTQERGVSEFIKLKKYLNKSQIETIDKKITPHLGGKEFSKNFAIMYGDKAALSVGYTPLGLPHMAGFHFSNSVNPQKAITWLKYLS